MLGWFKKKLQKTQAETPVENENFDIEEPHLDDSSIEEAVESVDNQVVDPIATEIPNEHPEVIFDEQDPVTPSPDLEPTISTSSSWLVRKSEQEVADEAPSPQPEQQVDETDDQAEEPDTEPPFTTPAPDAVVEFHDVLSEDLAKEPEGDFADNLEEEVTLVAEEPVEVDSTDQMATTPETAIDDPATEEIIQPVDKDATDLHEPSPVVEESDDSQQEEAALTVVKESEVQTKKKKRSLFSRLTDRLGKTRESFTYQIDALFLGKKEIDTALLDDLEEIMITADLGVGTTEELLDYTRRKVKRKELKSPEALKEALKEKIKTFILDSDEDATLVMPDSGPFVIMVIGVNGVGKTTTIGKIAHKFQKVGSSVMLVAADTFRAAAVSQLQIWGKRNGVPVVAHKEGADPSSVIFDALEIAQSKNIDVVLVDTAGRMHTKDNLMEELKKIKRVMGKKLAGSPHEIMLVIDATTGQNAISQARLFDDAVNITGLTLTKLDGTSKGGIVANICREMKIPIRFIGIGEKLDDLRDFDAEEFVDALFQGKESSRE